METSQKSKWLKRIIPVGIGILVFLALYFLMIQLFNTEGVAEVKEFGAQMVGTSPDYVMISAKLVSVDPVKGDLSMRLQFAPQGVYMDADGASLTTPLLLDLNSSTGKTEYNFKNDERMNPVDLTVSLYGGEVMRYPFDEHYADLTIGLYAVSEGKEGEAKQFTPVPFKVNFTGALPGYSITAEEWDKKEASYDEIYMTFIRSATTKFFAVFIMVLMWLLAIVALSVSLTCLITGRKIEATLFSWMGALLFAMVPLRNAMPAAPPIGALTDYISFFWAEILVALSLVIFVYTYLSRPLK
jgi:hypothetical protein